MPEYPKEIYLQGNLRLSEKRTVRQDARINNHNDGLNPGPTQRPNNAIPLKDWIQEQLTNNELDVPCTCEQTTNQNTVPQACVKLKKIGANYQPFSCSSTVLPEPCTRSYKIFSSGQIEIFSGTLVDAYTFMLEETSLGIGYHIVEYITCTEGESESVEYCFEKYLQYSGPATTTRLKPSCRCCEHMFIAFDTVINTECVPLCEEINFATLFESNMDIPVNVIIDNITEGDIVGYTLIQNTTYPLIYEFCPEPNIGTLLIEYHFEDTFGNTLGNSATVTINVNCN